MSNRLQSSGEEGSDTDETGSGTVGGSSAGELSRLGGGGVHLVG